MRFPEKYPEILVDIAHLLHARICQYLPAESMETTEALCFDLVEDLRRQYGGGLIYFQKGQDYERSARDAAILREFNGHNHRNLARRHGLAVATIYQILAREFERRQSPLFAE